MAVPTRTILYVLLGALMIDAVLEVALIGSMVAYLHIDHPMHIRDGRRDVILKGKPAGLMVDQGHTSNGAAGTALVLVGFVGLLLLTMRTRLERSIPKYYFTALTTWAVLCVLAYLLTLAALIYTFVVVKNTSGQNIDLSGLVSPIRYPYDKWTPQTWYGTILGQLTFVSGGPSSANVDGNVISYSTRGDVEAQLRLMNGWKWNLIPLFILQTFVTPLIVIEFLKIRRERSGSFVPASGKQEESRVV